MKDRPPPSPAVPCRPLPSPAVPRRLPPFSVVFRCFPPSPAVPCRPLPSPAVPCRPLPSPAVPAVPRRPPPSPAVPYQNMSQIVGLAVLPNDGRPGDSRTRTDGILSSRPVPGSWQSPRRALRGPRTTENTGLGENCRPVRSTLLDSFL